MNARYKVGLCISVIRYEWNGKGKIGCQLLG